MNMIILYDDVPCSLIETGRRFRGSMDLWNVCQFLQDYMAQHSTRQPSQKRDTFIFSPAEILWLITKVFCTSTVVTTSETHALERKLTSLMCVEVSYVKWSFVRYNIHTFCFVVLSASLWSYIRFLFIDYLYLHFRTRTLIHPVLHLLNGKRKGIHTSIIHWKLEL
jgi:hypothetical protein